MSSTIRPLTHALETADAAALNAELADDVVFHTPS